MAKWECSNKLYRVRMPVSEAMQPPGPFGSRVLIDEGLIDAFVSYQFTNIWYGQASNSGPILLINFYFLSADNMPCRLSTWTIPSYIWFQDGVVSRVALHEPFEPAFSVDDSENDTRNISRFRFSEHGEEFWVRFYYFSAVVEAMPMQEALQVRLVFGRVKNAAGELLDRKVEVFHEVPHLHFFTSLDYSSMWYSPDAAFAELQPYSVSRCLLIDRLVKCPEQLEQLTSSPVRIEA